MSGTNPFFAEFGLVCRILGGQVRGDAFKGEAAILGGGVVIYQLYESLSLF